MKSKKGDVEISSSLLIDLFIILIIVGTFSAFYLKIKDSRIHDLRFSAHEAAFSHDAALASPGVLHHEIKFKSDISVKIGGVCNVESFVKGASTPQIFECAASKRNVATTSEKNILEMNPE